VAGPSHRGQHRDAGIPALPDQLHFPEEKLKRQFAALLIALVLHGLLWQLAETKLLKLGEQTSDLLLGRPVNQNQHLDRRGIPYQSYADGSQRYNPLFVASLANQVYEQLTDTGAEQHFIRLCDWLMENSMERDGALWLPYGFEYPLFGMKVPWYSALAQAEAMTACARRWKHSNDPIWLQRSQAFARSLQPPSELTITMSINNMEDPRFQGRDGLWFMEYPGNMAPYVLNGHAAVLLELHRTHQLTPDPKLTILFERGFLGLTEALPRFDRKGFSLYSAEGELAGRVYHQKHLMQLRQLLSIKTHPILEQYLKRWTKSDRLPVLIQLVYNPRPRRILAFALSLVLIWLLCAGLARLSSKRGPIRH